MRRLAAQLLGLAAGLLLAAGPAAAKTLVFCSEGSPEGLNPQIVTTTTAMNAAWPMFNTLVTFAPGTTQLRPALAESWTVSADGREYLFRLREGVRFHANARFKPTRPLNAADVVFSLERQWRPEHPFHRISGAGYDYFHDLGMGEILEAIEALGEREVRIRLKRPDAAFLANLAMAFNAILSAEYASGLIRAGEPERLDSEPIGTGPFAFVGYQRDMTIRYRAFPDYWGGRQPVDNLIFSITPNPAVRLAKLRAGECHVMPFPNPADVESIAMDPTLALLRQEELNIGYLAMNTQHPPFSDLRVRRAVYMAVDRAAIIAGVYGRAGTVARNPIPPTLWSYDEAGSDYAFDPAEARRLLAEAGYADGFEADLWYPPVSRPYNPNGRRTADLIKADLARIGIRLNPVTAGWNEYRTKLLNGVPGLMLYGWTGDNGDPDNFLNVLLGCTAARQGGNNVARWCDPEYDALIEQARLLPDQAARAALYVRAQRIFKREAPWVPIAHSAVFMVARREVTGFRMDPLGRHLFEGVGLRD